MERCDARYAQFNSGALRACEFQSTQLQDADFRAADLKGAVFTRAMLNRADFTGAELRKRIFAALISKVSSFALRMLPARSSLPHRRWNFRGSSALSSRKPSLSRVATLPPNAVDSSAQL